jgi:large subunit ribosomal protein L32
MAVPRNRNSNARKNSKRSHHAKKVKGTSVCSKCSTARLPHCACPSCGAYHTRAAVATQAS